MKKSNVVSLIVLLLAYNNPCALPMERVEQYAPIQEELIQSCLATPFHQLIVEPGRDRPVPISVVAHCFKQGLLKASCPLSRARSKYHNRFPLEVALQYHDAEMVHLLVQYGAVRDLELPISRAVLLSNAEMVQLCIRSGAEVNVKVLFAYNNIGCKRGKNFETLLQESFSLLQVAILYSTAEIVGLLIEAGADVNYCRNQRDLYYDDHDLPFNLAAENVGSEEMARLLLGSGKINPADIARIFCSALQHNNLKKLEFLLACGVDPNLRYDGLGNTLLHVAVDFRRVEAIELLLRYGADYGLTDIWGKTPLDLSQRFFQQASQEIATHQRIGDLFAHH